MLTSSKNNEWETPPELYQGLNRIFEFTLDPASTHENCKCDKHYTITEDGLEQSWEGESVFCNPPYGREISKWVAKAYEESLKDREPKVLLIPARVDTAYWCDYCSKAPFIYFIRGRLKFDNRSLPSWRADGSHKRSPSVFPSAVIVFKSDVITPNMERSVLWCNNTFTKFW